MSTLTFRFYQGGSFSSRLIELTGKYSHVDAILPAAKPSGFGLGLAPIKKEGEPFITDPYSDNFYGARSDHIGHAPPGVQLRLNYTGSTLYTDYQLQVNDLQHATFWRFLWLQKDKPYDWQAILAFAVERDWRDDSKWFCSELQCAALEYAGIIPKIDTPVNKVTPGTLATILSVIGAKKL